MGRVDHEAEQATCAGKFPARKKQSTFGEGWNRSEKVELVCLIALPHAHQLRMAEIGVDRRLKAPCDVTGALSILIFIKVENLATDAILDRGERPEARAVELWPAGDEHSAGGHRRRAPAPPIVASRLGPIENFEVIHPTLRGGHFGERVGPVPAMGACRLD